MGNCIYVQLVFQLKATYVNEIVISAKRKIQCLDKILIQLNNFLNMKFSQQCFKRNYIDFLCLCSQYVVFKTRQ